MKIVSLVENISHCDLASEHGLCLYIETDTRKILFDVGPDGDVLKNNAEKMDVSLETIDFVVLSHGHYDHGGALKAFLEVNSKAKVYIQRTAFEKHMTVTGKNIGLDESLKDNERLVLLDGDYNLGEGMKIFKAFRTDRCASPMNLSLLGPDGKADLWEHEQNLLIEGELTVLIMGCGHSGVVNILESIQPIVPDVCVGGFHLFNPGNGQTAPEEILDEIAEELSYRPDTDFFTCHCTGEKAFKYLSSRLSNMHYLECGQYIIV